jgi:hypothetical protein
VKSVADELLKLRFAAGPIQSFYLNEDRVNERFTSHLGAITSWTRTAGKEAGGGIDLKVVKAEVKGSGGSDVTYGIDDPLARALLLRHGLERAGVIRKPEAATVVGEYVIASGRACLRHPEAEKGYPPGLVDHSQCIPAMDPRYRKLDFDRARAEAVRLALAGPAQTNDRMWLLVLTSGNEILAAAVLNSLWINDAMISYLHFRWTMFGTLRERIDNVPVLAAIHVWATLPTDVMFPVHAG